jgi:hypothetical protein
LFGEHHAAAIGSQPAHGSFDQLGVSHKFVGSRILASREVTTICIR